MIWTPERVVDLTVGLDAGLTYDRLAQHFCVTRSAIAGAVRRLVRRDPDLRPTHIAKRDVVSLAERRRQRPLERAALCPPERWHDDYFIERWADRSAQRRAAP